MFQLETFYSVVLFGGLLKIERINTCLCLILFRTERQWADLAVSLSLLSMCERGFKKLQECWECYSDKLTEDAVYQPLLSILAKLRRRAKPQFKVQ